MKNLKKAGPRKMAKQAHKIEGARVKAKVLGSTKVEPKAEVGTARKFLVFMFDTFKGPAVNWCIQNWPSICDTTGHWVDVILGMVS